MSITPPDPETGKGFSAVDDQPDPSFLVAGMEATAEWPAVIRLRAFERAGLALSPGATVLDVGCGIADVARGYAALVSPGGRVLGIDASEAMLAVARGRAAADGLEAEFRVGDALAIDEPDGSFDVVRSERMLQWLPDVQAGFDELVRVLAPGGRLCVADTDWRTLTVDLPDTEAAEAMLEALVAFRGASSAAGGRLLNLCRAAGLVDIGHDSAVHTWDEWEPELTPAPSGLFPLASVATDLVGMGLLPQDLADRFVEGITTAGRNGRFWMGLTMTAVVARRPEE